MATATQTAEILLYGEIGGEVNDLDFVRELKRHRNEPEVNIRINSGGGGIQAGLAIYKAMTDAALGGQRIITTCDGLAASMASVLMMAGQPRVMAANGLLMIHSPWMGTAGNARDLRKEADLLDKFETMLVGIYSRHSKQSESVVRNWMAQETWFNAQEAYDAGLIDLFDTDGSRNSGVFDVRCSFSIPERYVGLIRKPLDDAVEDIEWRCKMGAKARAVPEAESWFRECAFKAMKLTEKPGVATDDLSRCNAALRGLKARLDQPERFYDPY